MTTLETSKVLLVKVKIASCLRLGCCQTRRGGEEGSAVFVNVFY